MNTVWFAYDRMGMYERPEFEAPSEAAAGLIAAALGYDVAKLHVTTDRHHGTPPWQRSGGTKSRGPSAKDNRIRSLTHENGELRAQSQRAESNLKTFKRLIADAVESSKQRQEIVEEVSK